MAKEPSLFTRARFSSLLTGIGAVLAGTACASLSGNSELIPASLCIVFVVFAQLSANFYYRYVDLKRNSGTYIDHRISTKSKKGQFNFLKECSLAMFFIALMIGLALASMGGWWTLLIGGFIFVAAWLTCGGSTPLLRTPFGAVSSFILFGPVCVIGTCMLQVVHESIGRINWSYIIPAVYMGVVIGLMSFNATMLYGYANYTTDLRNSKVTLVGAVGRRWGRIIFLLNGFLYTAITVIMCLQLNLELNGVDMLPSVICLFVDIYIWWQMRTRPRYQYAQLIDLGNFNVFLMGLLSYIIFEITGHADLSQMSFFGL
ncbi:MAG: prenyltransferase [Muribaculaceae bacterium]|nr:prenyltransferase [Muribaculaceae bacterium]MDE6754183.1 prenyltransferase [Muribaculaceae bacterium]